jgi:hypothetical protein
VSRLPISSFKLVTKVVNHSDCVTLICPVEWQLHRYDVIRIVLATGKAYHLAREVPLTDAERWAARSTSDENRKTGY